VSVCLSPHTHTHRRISHTQAENEGNKKRRIAEYNEIRYNEIRDDMNRRTALAELAQIAQIEEATAAAIRQIVQIK
jgi:hypothetical protein